MSVFYQGDTLTLLRKHIPDKSVHLLYCDPPFGTTNNSWDEKQDWPALFQECFRVLKDEGMLIIHCSIPFNYELIRAAPKPPSHSWYWTKDSHTNPLISKIQPLRDTEEILIWKNKKGVYYPQKVGTQPQNSTYMTKSDYFGKDTKKSVSVNYGKFRTHHITMKRDIKGYSTRPKELVELMINSYSKEGDTVLDLFCYQGLSYSCKGSRRWIGMDKHFLPTALLH